MSAVIVPEHSRRLLEAISAGRSFELDSFIFVTADDWLMAIGYPQEGEFSVGRFESALDEAVRKVKPSDCFAIAPEMPERLESHVEDRDVYYTLDASSPVPPRLRGPVRHARERLLVDETREFTPEHRRLWAEFMGRMPLPPRIRQLYSGTAAALQGPADLRLLNAWDAEGQLAACLLMDYSLPHHVSYVLGAHSKTHYVPHAPDLLFAEMLERARAEDKQTVLLGLGVNEGITRFKRKWGGAPQLFYVMAQWQERPRADVHKVVLDELMQALVERSDEGLSKRQILDRLPDQRPFAMLWELEKQGRRSWICGTAHFFCYSFADSFRRLFRKVDTVIFEGPLDAESLAQVEACGKSPDPGAVPLDGLMTEAEIRRLERGVCGVRGPVARFLNMEWEDAPDVRERLHATRHWYAFFSLWTAFLERQGWRDSVDLEAWHLARDMGKTVLGMETMEEQLHSLEVVPVPRVLDFFRHCGQWRSYMRRNIYHYLRGELEPMMGTSTEFPTRTQQVIDFRDQRFRERMRPFIEKGGVAVFVGAAHMLRLRRMLTEDGFTVRQVRPTWIHRMRARLRGEDDLYRIPGDGDR